MILAINITTSYFGGEVRECFGFTAEEAKKGVDLAALFDDRERPNFEPLTAMMLTDDTAEVTFKDRITTINANGGFRTPSYCLGHSTVTVEGDDYDDDNCVEAYIYLTQEVTKYSDYSLVCAICPSSHKRVTARVSHEVGDKINTDAAAAYAVAEAFMADKDTAEAAAQFIARAEAIERAKANDLLSQN